MTRSFAAALLAFAAAAWAEAPPDPTTNPYLATVVGVSLELKVGHRSVVEIGLAAGLNQFHFSVERDDLRTGDSLQVGKAT